jgi:type IV pilus assembly protein PilN
MRISINLATRPFVELRPLFARMRLAMAALALLAVGLGFGLHSMKARARVDEAQMHELKVQTSVVENERAANEARMREPQNRAVLDRSKLLNALFEAKSFSWTAVMMDLENVLPAGVQVTSIEPVISAEGDVNIHLRVSGPRELQVDLVRNLERSQRFLTPRVANETAQQEEQGRLLPVAGGVPGGVEFDIVSGYKPLPAGGLNGPERKEFAEQARTGAAHKAGPMNKPAGKKLAKNGGAR